MFRRTFSALASVVGTPKLDPTPTPTPTPTPAPPSPPQPAPVSLQTESDAVNAFRLAYISPQHRRTLTDAGERRRLHAHLMSTFEGAATAGVLGTESAGAFLEGLASLGLRSTVRSSFLSLVEFGVRPGDAMACALLDASVSPSGLLEVLRKLRWHNVPRSRAQARAFLWRVHALDKQRAAIQARRDATGEAEVPAGQGQWADGKLRELKGTRTTPVVKEWHAWMTAGASPLEEADYGALLVSCQSLAMVAKVRDHIRTTGAPWSTYLQLCLLKTLALLGEEKQAVRLAEELLRDGSGLSRPQRVTVALRVLSFPAKTGDVAGFLEWERKLVDAAAPKAVSKAASKAVQVKLQAVDIMMVGCCCAFIAQKRRRPTRRGAKNRLTVVQATPVASRAKSPQPTVAEVVLLAKERIAQAERRDPTRFAGKRMQQRILWFYELVGDAFQVERVRSLREQRGEADAEEEEEE
eukprot:Rhum_TRINITY_DN9838_c0_g1::Rhum_TRINITY_DN9838_c0_g1_i1::g.35536::m.35536